MWGKWWACGRQAPCASLLLRDAGRGNIHVPLRRGSPGSRAPARHLQHGAGAAQHSHAWVLEAQRGIWWDDTRFVHCFLHSQCTNRRRGTSGWLCFQDVDQQRGEVRPAPFALAGAKLDVQHCEVSALLIASLIVKVRKGWGWSH